MSKALNRAVSLLLTVVLWLTFLPVSALAVNADDRYNLEPENWYVDDESGYRFYLDGFYNIHWDMSGPVSGGGSSDGDDPQQPQEEFEITTYGTTDIGVLTKYNGPGGHVVIPNGVTTIGQFPVPNYVSGPGSKSLQGAFSERSDIAGVTIPNSVTRIMESFYNCTGLTSITIPASVVIIDGRAFYGCTGLQSVTFSSEKINIGDYAFAGCTGLKRVTLPFDQELGGFVGSIGKGAFDPSVTIHGYSGSVSERFAKENGNPFVSIGDVTAVHKEGDFIIENGVLNGYTGQATKVTVPDGVTAIGDSAFNGFQMLESVTLPTSVTSIGTYAFSWCFSLRSINLPDGLVSIGNGAFDYCQSLTSLTLPKSLRTIDDSAFQNCSGLTSVAIPNGVTTIGSNAFYSCESLQSIVIPDSVTELGYGAFTHCTGLKSVTLSGSLKRIESGTFDYCTSLTEIVIPDGVTYLDSAFGNCISLTRVTIPADVATINGNPFYSASSSLAIYGVTGSAADDFARRNGIKFVGTTLDAPNLDTASDWAWADLSRAYSAGLIPENLQSVYTQTATRAEFCALAVAVYEKVMGYEISRRTTFADTDDINVGKAAAIGVVNGVGDNKFDPDAPLTREQAATMLARLANTVGTLLDNKTPATFSDMALVSPWALESVGQMQVSGIMSGVGGNRFAPADPYTREQSMITILRLYDYVNANKDPARHNTKDSATDSGPSVEPAQPAVRGI